MAREYLAAEESSLTDAIESYRADRRHAWGNLILETRIEFGHAARFNRSRYAGTKVHRIIAEYCVGRVDEAAPVRPGTFEAKFIAVGKPVLVSARPACGCTQGQHAAAPVAGMTADRVTCANCK
jgi:hypothetical protein